MTKEEEIKEVALNFLKGFGKEPWFMGVYSIPKFDRDTGEVKSYSMLITVKNIKEAMYCVNTKFGRSGWHTMFELPDWECPVYMGIKTVFAEPIL